MSDNNTSLIIYNNAHRLLEHRGYKADALIASNFIQQFQSNTFIKISGTKTIEGSVITLDVVIFTATSKFLKSPARKTFVKQQVTGHTLFIVSKDAQRKDIVDAVKVENVTHRVEVGLFSDLIYVQPDHATFTPSRIMSAEESKNLLDILQVKISAIAKEKSTSITNIWRGAQVRDFIAYERKSNLAGICEGVRVIIP